MTFRINDHLPARIYDPDNIAGNAFDRDNHYFNVLSGSFSQAQIGTGQLESEGLTTVPLVVDNGNGTVNISNVYGHIRKGTTDQDSIVFFEIDTDNYAVTEGTNFFIVKYNSGFPIIVNELVPSSVADGSEFIVSFVLVVSGSVEINTASYTTANRLGYLLNQKDTQLSQFDVVVPPNVREVGTLQLAASEAKYWAGVIQITTPDWDTTRGGANDNFGYWYKDNLGDWQFTTETVIDNQNFNGATGLEALGNNRYGVHWLYTTSNGFGGVVYGIGSYNLNDAVSVERPTENELPPFALYVAALAAKIIVQKDATIFYSLDQGLRSDEGTLFITEKEVFRNSYRYEYVKLTPQDGTSDTQYLSATDTLEVIYLNNIAITPTSILLTTNDLGGGLFDEFTISRVARLSVSINAHAIRESAGGSTQYGIAIQVHDGVSWILLPNSMQINTFKSVEVNDIETKSLNFHINVLPGQRFRLVHATNDHTKSVGLISSQFITNMPYNYGLSISVTEI